MIPDIQTPSIMKQTFFLAKEFFTENVKRVYAIGLFIFIIAFELSYVYIMVIFNKWNNTFYTAIQEFDIPTFYSSLITFTILAAIYIINSLIKTFLNMWLQLEWRTWMTRKYLNLWSNQKAFYGVKVIGYEADNPDQRIAQDINEFTSLFLSLTIGLVNAITTFLSFVVILWGLSNTITINLFGHTFVIYGWLVWAALGYSLTATLIMHKIGKPLRALLFQQERKEADFRYSLMRVREHAESIALYEGGAYENQKLNERFNFIRDNMKSIIKRQLYMGGFTSFYHQISIIFPFLVVAPRYFAKEITLGELMQISGAFGSVQNALSWVIDSYSSIANINAVTQRLYGFRQSIDYWHKAQAEYKSIIIPNEDNEFKFRDLKITLPNQEVMLECKSLTLSKKNYLISGLSGSGKSTLFRTLAGIWPFVKGEIEEPVNAKYMFIPQKSYMPHGTLKEVLSYPNLSISNEKRVNTLLAAANLEKFIDRIESTEDWGRILSGGEQQKIAFIRAILSKSDIIFYDESTSSMDEASEELMYNLVAKELPNIQIISISHRKTIEKFHDQTLQIKDRKMKLLKGS